MDISKVRSCRIHPAIGIARVGGSEEGYFIGPEIPGEQRVPPDPKYGFKDKHGELLRQVARFRVYGYDAEGNVVGELNAGNAEVAWGVHVANHKAAWYQFDESMDIPNFDGSGGTTPKHSDRRNIDITGAAREKLVIDPGPRTISGRNTKGKKYHFDGGKFFGKPVSLGEARTDDDGRLLVFGGRGVSASKDGKPAITFANNDGWHDDVSDGPVTATVKVNGKTRDAGHAWVVVAPPDYAPGVIALTTMYDVIRDAGWQIDRSVRPKQPSFTNDIGPIFQRLMQNQWVNAGFGKIWGSGSADDLTTVIATLAETAEYAKPLRRSYFERFRNPAFNSIEPGLIPPVYGDSVNLPALDPREWYAITSLQYDMLRQWAEGDFIADYNAKATPPAKFDDIPLQEQPHALDVAALGSAYLGAVSFRELRAALRLDELVDGAVERADAIFGLRREARLRDRAGARRSARRQRARRRQPLDGRAVADRHLELSLRLHRLAGGRLPPHLLAGARAEQRLHRGAVRNGDGHEENVFGALRRLPVRQPRVLAALPGAARRL